MVGKQSQDMPVPPVSNADHYKILKSAEERVKEQLTDIGREWLLLGFRVDYFEQPPEDGQEPGNEYKVDCGFLEAIDNAKRSNAENDEDWRRELEEHLDENLLPIEFVDELYEEVKGKLEESAGGQKLWVGVFGVLSASPDSGFGTACYCANGTRKRYYYTVDGETRSYCSSSPC
jgi:hypothetical protein